MAHDRYHPISGERGRPTTQNCHFRLPLDMLEALRTGAKARSIPTSVFVRDLLAEGLATRARRK